MLLSCFNQADKQGLGCTAKYSRQLPMPFCNVTRASIREAARPCQPAASTRLHVQQTTFAADCKCSRTLHQPAHTVTVCPRPMLCIVTETPTQTLPNPHPAHTHMCAFPLLTQLQWPGCVRHMQPINQQSTLSAPSSTIQPAAPLCCCRTTQHRRTMPQSAAAADVASTADWTTEPRPSPASKQQHTLQHTYCTHCSTCPAVQDLASPCAAVPVLLLGCTSWLLLRSTSCARCWGRSRRIRSWRSTSAGRC
jgi:hypothetical protein